MTMMAYDFLQTRRLAQAGRKKRVCGPPPQPSMPAIRQAIIDRISRPPPDQCLNCGGSLSVTHFKLLPK
jgi:hypothetical protein